MSTTLAEALADFQASAVLDAVNSRLDKGEDPMDILRELKDGMTDVGDKFSRGDYFLGELMMSADLFTKAVAIIEPKLKGRTKETIGKIVIGTPQGDIHDLGKNIFSTLAKGAGFEILDLGVNVATESFVEAVEKTDPDIIGFSALLTTSFESMKQIVHRLAEKGLRDEFKVIVGGGVTTKKVAEYVGADAQTIDAVDGLEICKRFVRHK